MHLIDIQPLIHGVGSYQTGRLIGPACWPHYDLILITQGQADFRIGGNILECPAGSSLLIPPQLPFEGRVASGGCTIWVQHFGYEASGKETPPFGSDQGPEIWCRSSFGAWTRALMVRAHELQVVPDRVDPSLPLVLALLLESLRSRDSERKNEERNPIADLISWLDVQGFPKPSIDEIAKHAAWSASHLRREFRRRQGCSLGQFVRSLHMLEAARLLRETNWPIKEISARLGYADPVAFHRAFVRSQRVTPARFRATAPRIF